MAIPNRDVRSGDYDALRTVARPGHADYTAHVKAKGFQDYRGGGHFSGRLTAPLVAAGSIAKTALSARGVAISAHIVDEEALHRRAAEAKAEGDSVGGTIECRITGLEAGLGGPLFGGMEGRIAKAVFAVPAIKGIEFGAGFAAAELRGSENNDPFLMENGRVITKTNNCGGILGGITNAMPLMFRVAVKPTPSIAREQITLNTKTQQAEPLVIGGRHDPCIVPRAVPCIEAAAAIAVYDALLDRRKEQI